MTVNIVFLRRSKSWGVRIMKSIKAKIIAGIIICTLLSSASIGFLSIKDICQTSDQGAEKDMPEWTKRDQCTDRPNRPVSGYLKQHCNGKTGFFKI